MSGEWITTAEAASYLGISISAVRRLIRERRIDARKLGYRTVRISVVSLEKMLEKSAQ